MDIHNYLEKLRGLPDKQKNIILWVIVAILGIIMVFFWFNSATKRISKIGESIKTIELPQIENQIPITETQKDETADWKTYTNNEYGFKFQYLSNFIYEIPKISTKLNSKTNNVTICLKFDKIQDPIERPMENKGCYEVSNDQFNSYYKEKILSSYPYVVFVDKNNRNKYFTIMMITSLYDLKDPSTKEVKINNELTAMFGDACCDIYGNRYNEYLIKNDENYYLIFFDKKSFEEGTIKQIISTFKFTK